MEGKIAFDTINQNDIIKKKSAASTKLSLRTISRHYSYVGKERRSWSSAANDVKSNVGKVEQSAITCDTRDHNT